MSSSQQTIVALELSQRQGTIAIALGDGESHEIKVEIGNRESDSVFPAIESLATALHITPQDIDIVAVSIGPGGFTGLRTAVAIAKMIAFVTGAKIIRVETAVVQAETLDMGSGPFFVFSGMKQNNVWFSKVYKDESGWNCDAKHTTAEKIRDIDSAEAIIVDANLPTPLADAAQSLGMLVHVVQPSATCLLAVARQMYARGSYTDVHDLRPLYPREPEAVRMWNARKAPIPPKPTQ